MYLFFLFVTFNCLIICNSQNEDEINKYINAINEFQVENDNYVPPVDNSAFLNGRTFTKECKLLGDFDFIIVGAGSSGSVIANRLTENPETNVLLIEAGGEETIISDIPAMFLNLQKSDLNWGYKSVPQTRSLFGFINNSEAVPRGKVLGGSSTINAMVFTRGSADDFNKWAMQGNPGWSYNDVLPYFKKSEHANFTNPDPKYRGFHGPLNINLVNYVTPLISAFIEANQELGRNILDYNAHSQNGSSIGQLNQVHARRNSVAKAFLKPIRHRSNLKVVIKSLVTKILIREKKAFGVRYLRNGYQYCAHARKEVIISAGAFNSPQLLMLSGIGPEDHLIEQGISVIQHLPGVGQNMWDHICLSSLSFTTNYTGNSGDLRHQVKQYLRGISSVTDTKPLGFYYQPHNNLRPEIETIFTMATPSVNTTYEYNQNYFGLTKDNYNYVVKPLFGKNIWNLFFILLHPKSRGSVKLKSNSPIDFPLIDPNYFSNSDDLDTFAAEIKNIIYIFKTNAMQKFNSQLFKIDLPNCRTYEYESDQYYRCIIQHLASTIYHSSGTCKMGPVSDKMSVVDENLNVRGIKNLRIADCSVIPVTISGHTNAVCIMIGEKASDLIKEYYKI